MHAAGWRAILLLFAAAALVGSWAAAHTIAATATQATVQAAPTKPAPPTQAPPPKAPATVAPGSCLQCHGALTKQATVHPPAADDCSTCHTQQGKEHRFTLAAPGAELCTTCHEVITPSDKFVHGPVAVGDCLTCHDPHGAANPKLLRAKGSALCETCHIEVKAKLAESRFQHAPVSEDCAKCHNPHGSPFKYQLRAEGASLCVSCHKDLARGITAAAVKHDAVTMDRQCLNCHEAHAANVRPLLRSATMPLCLKCHDREVAAPGGTLKNIKAWLDANPVAHGPIRQQDCVACHKPHASEHFRLLKQDYPAKFYSPFEPRNYELCFSCHQADLVKVERTTTVTGFRDGDRNLHFLHVNRTEKGRTCRACHEVHSSTKPKHIRENVPYGSWALPINYESAEGGGRCAPGCHMPVEYRRTSKEAPRR